MTTDNSRPAARRTGRRALPNGSPAARTGAGAGHGDTGDCPQCRRPSTGGLCPPCSGHQAARAALAEAVEYHLAVAVLVGWQDVLTVVGYVHDQFSRMLVAGRDRPRRYAPVLSREESAARALRDLAEIQARRHFVEHTGVAPHSPVDPDREFRISGRRLVAALVAEQRARRGAAEALLQQRLAYVRSLRIALAEHGADAITSPV
ncbi:hypothetical protein [Kitasatospora sp. NPDC002965]|uniref:hypothetical protein n=1 Tax=Kitasatospora sp. NPDC002965 TaxID=3154775 RepID=UPI00339F4B5A